MTFVTATDGREAADVGFTVVAGNGDGLRRLMIATGVLPTGDIGPVHSHGGDEVIRVLSGIVMIRIGEERRLCQPGDIAVIPPGVEHGFVVEANTVLDVVAEQEMGSFYALREGMDEPQLVEVHRPDVPWDRPPPDGQDFTTPEMMAQIAVRVVGV